MTTTTPALAPPSTTARPREHHLIEQGSGSRLTLCGRIPPWDLDQRCSGDWRGGGRCPTCGEETCPTCVSLAREGFRR